MTIHLPEPSRQVLRRGAKVKKASGSQGEMCEYWCYCCSGTIRPTGQKVIAIDKIAWGSGGKQQDGLLDRKMGKT